MSVYSARGMAVRRLACGESMRAVEALTELMDAALLRDRGLPLTRYGRMILVKSEAVRLAELAELVVLSPRCLLRQVTEIERAGLLERSRDPHDGRGVVVMLTGKGLDTLARMEKS